MKANNYTEIVLGNEKLSLLTMNKNFNLRIEIEDFDGGKRCTKYSAFAFNPAFDQYRLTDQYRLISGYAGGGSYRTIELIHFTCSSSL